MKKICLFLIIALIVLITILNVNNLISIKTRKYTINPLESNYDSIRSSNSSLTEFEKAIQEVEYSYYMRGTKIQYNSEKVTYFSPEESTSQNTNYMVCSGYTRNVYNELLGIKIPSYTASLLTYSRENVGNPEVIAYGAMNGKNFVMKMYDTSSKKIIKLTNPSLKDIIPYLKIGDVLTYTGHTFIVYDLIDSDNDKVTDDAWIIESGHGKGKTYVYAKITPVSPGSSNHFLYHNSYQNTIWKDNGLVQGSLNARKLADYDEWVNINTSSRRDEYSILRFVTTDSNKNMILNYQGAKYNDSNHTNEKITLSKKIQNRLTYSRIYIEKTVDAHADDIVEANNVLKYTITIKNNSKKDYTSDISVSENISKYVTYIGYSTTSKKILKYTKDLDNNKVEWKIGKISSGETITISYTVKVKSGYTGKTITSTGYVENIPSSIVKNKIGINLTQTEEKTLIEKYNSLKTKYTGKKLINEIYKQSFGINLNLDSFDITNLIANNNKKSREVSTILLNSKNNMYQMILDKYWSTMTCYDCDTNTTTPKTYDLKNWGLYTNSNRRQDTIYSENFKTGDILIYTNKDDKRYIKKTGTYLNNTYENGEYAYIYISGKGFIGVNLGSDGKANTKDDRNEFNSAYYSNNSLSVIYDTDGKYTNDKSFLEFANYQTLFGKDYYVILRPSLKIKNNPVTVTSKSNLVFNNTNQELVTINNNTSNLNVCLSLTELSACSKTNTSLTKKDPGTYKVYYYISGGDTYFPKKGYVNVTISKNDSILKETLTKKGYKIKNNYVSGFKLNDTLTNVKSKLGLNYTTDSKIDKVATGITFKYNNETFVSVVYGDLNGDGNINSADLLKMQKYLLEEIDLSGAYKEAGLINDDNIINSADLLRIKQHLLNENLID